MTLSDTLDSIERLTEAKQDQAYALLLAVMRSSCKKQGNPHWHSGQHYRAKEDCRHFFMYSWDDAPNGALEGAFIKALARFADDNYGLSLPGALHSLLMQRGDTREAAAELVVRFLEGKRP